MLIKNAKHKLRRRHENKKADETVLKVFKILQ